MRAFKGSYVISATQARMGFFVYLIIGGFSDY